MYRISTNISQKNFEKMISGTKGFLPSEVKRALSQGQMSKYLYQKSIKKEDALKVIRFLKEKGMIKGSPSSLYNHTGKLQNEEDEKEKEEKIKKNARVIIAQEVSEEAQMSEKGLDPMANYYDPRSQLGKSENRGRILDVINGERADRQKKIDEEQAKRKKIQDPRKKGERPPLADMGKFIDMDIG